MGLLSRTFGPRVPIITSPRVAVLDLLGAPASDLLQADRQMLDRLFGETTVSTSGPRQCDVLFVYCTIGVDGSILGTKSGLRELVRDSGAAVVVFASANRGDAYIKAARPAQYGKANLVMTLDRKGDAFGRFFEALFADMKRGVSMPSAWVKLAPQIPGHKGDVPDCIFACEAGQLAFR